MRCMVVVKATKESEEGVIREELLYEMEGNSRELVESRRVTSRRGASNPVEGETTLNSWRNRTVIDGSRSRETKASSPASGCGKRSMEEGSRGFKRAAFDGGARIEIRQGVRAQNSDAELTPGLRDKRGASVSNRVGKGVAMGVEQVILRVDFVEASFDVIVELDSTGCKPSANPAPKPETKRRDDDAIHD